MAIAYVAERGSFSTSGTASTVVTALTGTVPVGDLLILIAGWNAASTVNSIADTQGNAWQTDRTHTRGASFTRGVFSTVVTTQLTSSDTVTVTLSAAQANRMSLLEQFSGIATSSWFDQVASLDGSSGNLDSGLTGTTAQADELIIGGHGAGTTDMTFTPGTGFSQFTTPELYNGQNLYAEYKIVSSVGTYRADGSQTSSQAWCSICTTYKAAVAAAEKQSYYATHARRSTRRMRRSR